MRAGAASAPLLSLALLAGCAALEEAPPAYRNPLTAFEFADPALLRAPDGWYYAYATQGRPAGRTLNIQVARSRDLVRWDPLGDALPRKPSWGASKQWFWAPHALYDGTRGQYFLYYSAEPDDGSGKCLAVATAHAPQGPFVDSGRPLVCGEGIEHIDPMAFDDPATGRRWLYWGSGRKPLKAQPLAEDRISFLPGSSAKEVLESGGTLVEAPWLVQRGSTYYLFYSAGLCCGPRASYSVHVARSANAEGPFEHLPVPLLEGNDAWLAPGHPAVARDAAGNDWLFYHAASAAAAKASALHPGQGVPRVLMLERLSWRDGWPRVDPGAPSSSPQAAPAY